MRLFIVCFVHLLLRISLSLSGNEGGFAMDDMIEPRRSIAQSQDLWVENTYIREAKS